MLEDRPHMEEESQDMYAKTKDGSEDLVDAAGPAAPPANRIRSFLNDAYRTPDISERGVRDDNSHNSAAYTFDTLAEASEQLRDGSEVQLPRLAVLEARAQASARVRATPVAELPAVARSPSPESAAPSPPPNSVRVASEKLDALLAASGALFATRTSLEQRRDETERLFEDMFRWTQQWRRSTAVSSPPVCTPSAHCSWNLSPISHAPGP